MTEKTLSLQDLYDIKAMFEERFYYLDFLCSVRVVDQTLKVLSSNAFSLEEMPDEFMGVKVIKDLGTVS